MEPLLDVTPAHAINFDLVVGKTLETELSIRNPRSSTIVFKVKTTAPKRYCVRPNSSVIKAHESMQVRIVMQVGTPARAFSRATARLCECRAAPRCVLRRRSGRVCA